MAQPKLRARAAVAIAWPCLAHEPDLDRSM